MLALTRKSSSLNLEFIDEIGKRKSMNLAKLSWLSIESQESYLLPAVDFFNGRSPGTQFSSLCKLIRLGGLMGELKWEDFPKSSREWQDGLLLLYSNWLSRPEGGQLYSRITIWNGTFSQHLTLLRDVVGLIPYSVVIPRAAKSIPTEDLKSHQYDLLGLVEDEPPLTQDQEKLLVSVNLDRTDAEYLDFIRDTLAHRRAILNNCANEWIKQIASHFRFGEELIKATSWKDVSSIIESGRWRHFSDDGTRAKGLYHFANGQTKESLGSLLSILINRYDSMVSKELLASQPELPHLCTIDLRCAPPALSNRIKTLTRLNWMLGNLSPYDMGFILLFVTLRHPKFTPQSLVSALATDKNGHSYFELSDLGMKWRLEKRRAHKMKSEILDDDTEELLTLVADMTRCHRKRLQEQGDPLARSFFLLADRGECRAPDSKSTIRCLTGRGRSKDNSSDSETWLGNLFPAVQESGIEKGTLTLRKVRATEGVLEWFKSGSVASMANKLGNSTRVALEHYLPKPLIRAWHVRQLRTFQNLWLAVATEGTALQLAATDFTELTQLHQFLQRMLNLYPEGSSPLASELHLRCAATLNRPVDQIKGRLAVSISAVNLAYLYLYQQSVLEAGLDLPKLSQTDSITELSPQSLVSLAELLRFRTPEDKNQRIRRAHAEALTLLPVLKNQTNWTDIIIEWGVSR